MFNKKLYVTEISLNDFKVLPIDLKSGTMIREDNTTHYGIVVNNAGSVIDYNLDFYKSEGVDNVLVVIFKKPTEEQVKGIYEKYSDEPDRIQALWSIESHYVKYYTKTAQNYIMYPGCTGAYRKRGNITFTFNGESFYLPERLIENIYIVHI